MHRLRPDAGDPRALASVEWLLTNGLGGYALGTALGIATRRYHGLLVAAAEPPVRRVVVLEGMVEQLELGGRAVELSTHCFGPDDRLHPDGWTRLVEVAIEPGRAVWWTWRLGDVEVARHLLLRPGANHASLIYTVRGLDRPAVLRLRPLVPLRDFHGVDREADSASRLRASLRQPSVLDARRGDLRAVLDAPGLAWRAEPQWWRDFSYAVERDRGQAWRGDCWSPGVLEVPLAARAVASAQVDVSLAEPVIDVPPRAAVPADPERPPLRRAGDQFVVGCRAGDAWSTTIIAGYPWFTDWGRDAMIALPGLLLAGGRLDEAREVLRTFALSRRRGLIPNRFDDHAGDPHYETVDASLWLVHAVGQLAGATREVDAELLDACRDVVSAYRAGTDHGIGVDPADGLVRAGDPTTSLTWMDARRDDVVFTPRDGKPVEINALWHNALRVLAALVDDGAERAALEAEAGAHAASFAERFWWPERRCLHDRLVERDGAWTGDAVLRPNQIFAASLPFAPLPVERRRDVVEAVGRALLTPYGLRTLDPAHPDYVGRYEGELPRRDAAYHQGTVWPWLLGPYAEALLRAHDFDDASRARARALLAPLLAELDRGCLGQIAEVYDGDPPHRADGCPAQAWSVAELLRIEAMLGAAGSPPRS